ncbi:unnamed protein product (macronuclear) [Paramecium tetraurelia]|uniref:mitogen-activated protein kinase kinase n=1 Tax=Paramecium tetraurelia TaxID=5888 RepID=A0DF78_PARTE|nr:uncharacterized protein GSPATT00016508001 [Paramecium tetraurelia]CAK81695.1 unnamed protein product [Paramecium tetraurelia]|eukprot:XP_001449092.1 hypothetical protein (macronuclear) [Paramecium tetraurelia strain d4-2]
MSCHQKEKLKYQYKQYRNILHLDIKPDNVLISKKGNVKICDFGEAHHPLYPFQREGIKYSVPFTAPEILRNNEVTNKADVFSFGVLAYELLFGKLPIAYMSKKDYIAQFKVSNFNVESDYRIFSGPRKIEQDMLYIILHCKITYILGLCPNKDDRFDINTIYENLKNQNLKIKNYQI